ncbi:MAG: glycosyltransferase family 4 protein [Acidobacteriota bacterium]|nr:MAG: glycosyltransferase family 4 protein [Acidobacteriota bacterium]
MRVLTLVPNQKGHAPGQRGSIELWERILKPEGIQLEYAPFESERLREILYKEGRHFSKAAEMVKSYAKRIGLLKSLDEYDAVFVYREAALLGPAFLEKLIARKKPIIYQLDDPLFVPYRSPSNGYLSYLKFFGKIKEIVRISKVVIVNSSHIREFAAEYNGNIWQVPSVVDTEQFRFAPFEANGSITVGWSGSPTTVKNLKLIEKPLQEISARGICDFLFIGSSDPRLKNVQYTAKEWKAETEVEDLRKMQIGLVPLPDRPWNRYKFIMKTAQYMALGIVPVGTPMASNTEVIRHGENGFLAATDAEWVEYLSLLSTDNELRERLSEVAARDAVSKYSLQANAPKIVEAFRAALS